MVVLKWYSSFLELITCNLIEIMWVLKRKIELPKTVRRHVTYIEGEMLSVAKYSFKSISGLKHVQ